MRSNPPAVSVRLLLITTVLSMTSTLAIAQSAGRAFSNPGGSAPSSTSSRVLLFEERWLNLLCSPDIPPDLLLSEQNNGNADDPLQQEEQQLSTTEREGQVSASDHSLFVVAVASVPVTLALLQTDQQTYSALHGWKTRSSTMRKLSPVITGLGDGRVSLGMFGGLLVYGLYAEDQVAKRAGVIGLESFALSGATTQLLKHLFSRERPSAASRRGGKFSRPFAYFRQNRDRKRGYANYDAFPSGHTATVFAAAATLTDVYRKPWLSYTSYATASAVAISRITESTHWVSDCFVGALVGVFSTKVVEWLNDRSSSVSIVPQSDSDDMGIMLSIRF